MKNEFENFGEFIKAKRMKSDVSMSLRKLAENMDVSAPFWCDIEKNRKMPSMDYAKLNRLAELLKLSDNEKNEMFDLAGKSRNELPADIVNYLAKNDSAAFALRTAKELKLKDSDWKSVVEFIKQRSSDR